MDGLPLGLGGGGGLPLGLGDPDGLPGGVGDPDELPGRVGGRDGLPLGLGAPDEPEGDPPEGTLLSAIMKAVSTPLEWKTVPTTALKWQNPLL